MQTVEYTNDALTESGATHNTVIYNHQIVHIGAKSAVSDVINVRRQIVATAPLGDKRTKFDVLNGNFFMTYMGGKYTN